MDNQPAAASRYPQHSTGARKNSKLIPLLVTLVITVLFCADAIQRSVPDVLLQNIPVESSITAQGQNLVVIARIGDAQELHFRMFDQSGKQILTRRTEAEVVADLAKGDDTAARSRPGSWHHFCYSLPSIGYWIRSKSAPLPPYPMPTAGLRVSSALSKS